MFDHRLVVVAVVWATGALFLGTAEASDDAGALGAVVENLSQKVLELGAKVDACNNEIQELKKLEPSVVFSAQNSNYKFSVSDGSTISFDNVLINRGRGFSASHGEFTVPVSGLYYISYRGWSYVRHTGYFFLNLNGHSISELPFGDEDHESASSQSLVLHLNRGDVLSLSLATSGTIEVMGGDRSTFMGYLVKAD